MLKKILKTLLKLNTDETGLYWLKEIDINFLFKNYFLNFNQYKFVKEDINKDNSNNIDEVYNFYLNSNKEFKRKLVALSWKKTFDSKFVDLFFYLNKKKLDKANKILHNMQENQILHGLDFADYINNKNTKAFKVLTIFKMQKLFHYLGLKNCLQTEGIIYNLNILEYKRNLDFIKKKYKNFLINKKINKKPAIKIKNYNLNATDIQSLYSSLRVKEIIDRNLNKKKKINILEIGAGLGKTTINIIDLMSKKLNKIIIVDLFPVNLIQIYNFLNYFDKKIIWYPGCKRKIANCKIIIVPSDKKEILSKFKLDLIFNENSFPEMQGREIDKFIKIFKNRGNYLFSINHETSPNQNEYVHNSFTEKFNKSNIRLVDRRKSWIRNGYYENLYLNKP